MSNRLASGTAVIGLLISGCHKPAEKPAGPAPASVAAPPAAQPPAASHPGEMGILARTSTRLVDKPKALAENPKLVVLEDNKQKVEDPLTYAFKAYFSLASQATMLALTHDIEIQKAINDDHYPSFEEFDRMLKQAGVHLNGLYRWQVYAYDAQDGSICILEDRDMKRAEYEKAGLEYKE